MGFFAVRMVAPNPPKAVDGDPSIGLRRRIPSGRNERTDFLLSEPFGYRHVPAEEEEGALEIVVPDRTADSASDLASVPAWLGWVVAKTGPNLPAALVHDVLVVKTDRDGNLKTDSTGRVLSPVNHWWRKEGQRSFTLATKPYDPADRRRADRMLRDGMGDVGVDPVRRWLMWAAVAAGTLWVERPRGWRGWIDAARVLALLAVVAAGAVLLPYLILDLANVGWAPAGSEGSMWTDLRDAGLIAVGLTALGSGVAGLWARERHQWVLGLLAPAAILLSWAVAATLLGGLLLGLIRFLGKDRPIRFVGEIAHFYSQIGVAVIEIEGVGLRLGDRISVLGHTTILEDSKVESMEHDRRPVTGMVAGSVAVKVKMGPGTRLRPGDKVYLHERTSGLRDR